MSLPATVRVKLSSEAAEGISITRVVVQDLPLRDLVEHMLGITGKNEARVRELLLRGTLVSGASRFRWAGWEAGLDDLRELLATFPADDPARPFVSERCVRAVLRGGRQAIHIPREAAGRKPPLLKKWLRQASFEVDDNGGVLTLVQLDRDPSALRALEPFQRRRAGLAERCQEPPTTTTVRLLGAYRLTLGPDDPA